MSENIDAISPWLQVLWDRQGSDLLLATGSKPRVTGRRQAERAR